MADFKHNTDDLYGTQLQFYNGTSKGIHSHSLAEKTPSLENNNWGEVNIPSGLNLNEIGKSENPFLTVLLDGEGFSAQSMIKVTLMGSQPLMEVHIEPCFLTSV